MILKDQITNIFVKVDDFCKEFEQHIKQMKIEALPDGVKEETGRWSIPDTELSITL